MTIAEAINMVDKLKPNRFDLETKVGWLSQLEDQIYEDIVKTHENPMRICRPMISMDTEPDTRLIAPPPYDEVYKLWLMCQIDLGNMEIGKYNNDRKLYNNALVTLRDYWNRTYMPCERAHCFIFDDRRRRRPMPYDGHPIHHHDNPLGYGPAPHPIDHHEPFDHHHMHGPLQEPGPEPGPMPVPFQENEKPHKPRRRKPLPPFFGPKPEPMNSMVEEIVQIHATDAHQRKHIKRLENAMDAVHATDSMQERDITGLKGDLAEVRAVDANQARDISQLRTDLEDSILTEMTAAEIGEIIN